MKEKTIVSIKIILILSFISLIGIICFVENPPTTISNETSSEFQEVENITDWIEWCKEINGTDITFYRNGSIICHNGGENER